MTQETFPFEQSGQVAVPQESILLPRVETAEVDWPVHEVKFNRKPCTLIIDVGQPGLVDRLVDEGGLSELAQHGFQPKQELHITVINYENGGRILDVLNSLPPDQKVEMLQAVEDMASSRDWTWRPAGGLHAFQGRKKRALKIITHVECPAFGTFYEDLSRLMPTAELELYSPHITLLKRPGETKPQTPSYIGDVVLSPPILSFNYPTIEG